MKRSGDSPMYAKLVEKMKECKEQERAAQQKTVEQLANNGNEAEKEASKDEPPQKKVKSGTESEKTEKKPEVKAPEKKEVAEANGKHPQFDEEKYLRRMDKWCENCRKDMPDPKPSELVMFLHAVKFKVRIHQTYKSYSN